MFLTRMGHLVLLAFFVVLFQFFGSALTFAHFPLPLLLFFSATLACLGTVYLSPHITIQLSTQSKLAVAGIASVCTFLFSLRLNWHIPDYICPTGLLGLVGQVDEGTFPVSFLSFPDIVMNYHQGFVFLAGSLAWFTPLSAGAALKITYIVLYFLLNLLASLYFKSVNSRYYLVVPILFLTITSLSPILFVNLGLFYNFVSIFEQSTSNSFPLTFITILLFLFVIDSTATTRKKILLISLLLLTTATSNATLFSVALLASVCVIIFQHTRIAKLAFWKIAFFAGLGVCLYGIVRYIPSAFLAGSVYAMPDYGIRILEEPIVKYIKHIGRYMLLCGPITGLGLSLAYQALKRRQIDSKTVLSVTLVISFIFPIIVIFSNIDMWDNLHKFAILSLFISLLLTLLYLGTPGTPRFLGPGLLVCVLLSTPAIYDQLAHRWSDNYQSHLSPADDVRDVVSFLKDNRARSLIPYAIDIGGQCDEDHYAGVSEFAGIPLLYAYFPNFLLAPAIEDAELKHKEWSSRSTTIATEIKNLAPDSYIIIRKGPATSTAIFMDQLDPESNRQLKEFTNFYLY